ncbi:MAG TPA: amidase [Bryobacteraceae bacterium]|nr:amidase [Bryobacteraceae bacterium]
MNRRTFLGASLGAAAGLAFGESTDLAALTLKKASDLLRSKSVSPVDLTKACLARIEKYQPRLNAYITVTGDEALNEARAKEAELRHGRWRGPLDGVPIALKDNIDTAGVRTTAASELFKDRVPAEDAEVVRRLKNAGAIFLGKLNLHEFAYGGTSAVTYFHPVHNPWNPALTPGGSSGGPGAAVSADLCFASLGTDTAGSVRIPASYCGIVGLKPTYGRVSLRGVIPLSWSLDHVGPMCKTVEDAALLLQVVAGYDPEDPTTADVPVPDYARALRAPTSRLRLGIPRKPFYDNLNPDVGKAMDAALALLGKLTARTMDIELPPPAAGPILGAESYAYHAQWFTKTPQFYQPQVRAALQRASTIKTDDYARGLRNLAQIRRDIGKVFANVDLLVLPTMADPPFKIEEGLNRNVSARNTSPFDVYGIPTISIPCGFTRDGLPIGMQIAGAPWTEPTVLALAHAYEQATDWHQRRPPLESR